MNPTHRLSERSFDSLYSHGFARVAAAVPEVRIADPAFNAERTIELARRAADAGAALIVFPELCLSAYSNEDLFREQALQQAVVQAIEEILVATGDLSAMIAVGAPLAAEGALFNTGVVIHRGRILGVIPKSFLPQYREYYEKRQFRAARDAI